MVEISLAGKVAVVTGSSRGVGRAIALRLAEAGCRGVTINYVQNRERGLEVVRELEERGAEGLLVQADVGEEEDANRLIKETYDRFGRIDILVNNAGICPRGTFFDTPLA
ncbi:MAG: SDR family NAD(P)-dependent oxidoreductase, partial [bacterium]